MTLRIGMIDDHELFRDGIKALLAKEEDLSFVGEAGDANSGYELVEREHPDVVILDVALPGASGVTVARELLRRDEKQRILFVSMHASEEFVIEGLAAGAAGWVSKSQSSDELLTAIRTVGEGKTYLAPEVSHLVLGDYRRLRNGGSVTNPLSALSRREREVFELILRGFGNDGIARQLFVSPRTIETHRASVMRKLNLHSLADLFRFAARHGLLTD